VVVSAQFMTPTATRADVILPVQSFAERDGTFTSGMRRVQRFYMAQGVVGESLPSWRIFARLGALMGGDRPRISAGLVMRDITQSVLRYSEMGFTDLARVEPQSPYVGDEDRYYGGTAYRNEGGLGIQWLTNAEREKYLLTVRPVKTDFDTPQDLMAVPIRLLFNREALFEKSNIMHHRVPAPFAEFNVEDADRLGFSDGDRVALVVDDRRIEVAARVNGKVPLGVVLLPLHLAPVPMPTVPVACAVEKIEE
jgi:NADH-quinone oxidoreductase subunit G